MDIRKLIKEELEKILDKEQLEKKFDQDIHYLNNFELIKKEKKGQYNVWVFTHKSKDYTIRFYIQENNQTNSWKAKVFIYWKVPTREFTNAKGKDFEFSFGPYDSYDEMVTEINRKLQNNPLISASSFLDDNKTQFDNDVFEMLKLIQKRTPELMTIKDKHFNDIKKIAQQINQFQEEDLKKYIDEKAPEESDKQTLLLILQKIYQVTFYKHKEDIESLF